MEHKQQLERDALHKKIDMQLKEQDKLRKSEQHKML
jgi:hypothetical protein